MTEEKKTGFLKKAAGEVSKAAGGAINNAKDKAKEKATEYVVNQAKKNTEKKIDNIKSKFLNKK